MALAGTIWPPSCSLRHHRHPKGVLHTHAKLVESCRAAVYPFGLTPHSSTLNMFTTSFMGWSNLALPYFNIGARQVFHDHWDPKRVLRTIAEERLTNLLLVPTMWRLLLREDVESYDLSRYGRSALRAR